MARHRPILRRRYRRSSDCWFRRTVTDGGIPHDHGNQHAGREHDCAAPSHACSDAHRWREVRGLRALRSSERRCGAGGVGRAGTCSLSGSVDGVWAAVWLRERVGAECASASRLDSRPGSLRRRQQTCIWSLTEPRRTPATTSKLSTPARPDGRIRFPPSVACASISCRWPVLSPHAINGLLACRTIRSGYRSALSPIALAGRSGSASPSPTSAPATTRSASGVANARLHKARPSPAPTPAPYGGTGRTPRSSESLRHTPQPSEPCQPPMMTPTGLGCSAGSQPSCSSCSRCFGATEGPAAANGAVTSTPKRPSSALKGGDAGRSGAHAGRVAKSPRRGHRAVASHAPRTSPAPSRRRPTTAPGIRS
jgi:hypothetical protein